MQLTRGQGIGIGFVIGLLVIGAILLAVLLPSSKPKYDINQCRVQNCGQIGPNFVGTRIVGGRFAMKDEFPYQVAFTDSDGDVFCGGSMINDRWVVGAAHCFFRILLGGALSIRKSSKDMNVSVAIHDVSEVKLNQIEVENFWAHPQYKKHSSKMYDIVLVKTKKSIKASSKNFVNPICLPYEDLDETIINQVKVSGFGTTEEDGESSDILKTTTLEAVEDAYCEHIYKKSYDSESMMCAGSLDLIGGDDTCQGDSGGPLAIRNKNGSYVLKGITSYGRGCGQVDTPGVYTKVSHYLDWACKTMVDNGLD